MKEKKHISWKDGILLAIVLTLFLRFLLFVVGYNFAIRFNRLPLTTREMDFSENIPMDKKDPWYYIVSPLHRFDALWYEEIAKNNYKNQPLTTAFFPLYPWIVGSIGRIFHTTFAVSAFFINTFLTVIVFYLLYHLARMDYDSNTAIRAVIAFAFFPTSFFLLVPYADVLVLIFILLSIIFARKNFVLFSIISGYLASMTKPYGAAIFLPLLLIFYKSKKIKNKILITLVTLTIPFTFLIVNKYQAYLSGSTVNSISAQQRWGVRIPLPWEPIRSLLSMFTRNPFDLPNTMNLITVIVASIFLIYYWRRVIMEYYVLILSYLFIFYFFQYRNNQFVGMSKHFITFFPIFLTLSNIKIKKIYEVIYLVSSTMLLLIFFIFYTFGFFVA